MRHFVDIRAMPGYNPEVKDGADSVTRGLVRPVQPLLPRSDQVYPYCRDHGAMNKVSKDGIWRCLVCGVGCFEVGG